MGGPPPSTGHSITFVNSWSMANANCTSGTTCAITVSPAAGHTLLVQAELRTDIPASLTSIGDNQTNSYSSLFSKVMNTSRTTEYVYCASNIAASTTTVTVTMSVYANPTFNVLEYAGLSCTTDGATSDDTNQGSNAYTSNSITPTAAQYELLFCAVWNNVFNSVFTPTGSGTARITSGYSDNDFYLLFASDRIITSTTGSYTCSGTFTQAGVSVANLIAIKAT
jgi:hypothetical protein